MKITRKQIRKVIRESLLTEGGMKERFGEIQSAAIFALEGQPGVGGEALATAVMEELSDYGMIDAGMAITQEEVFETLDIMLEDGEVFFDIEEDKWYMADSPQAQAAMQAMVNR